MFNWKQIELKAKRIRIEKQKILYLRSLSLSLSQFEFEWCPRGHLLKKKKCEFLPCEFFFSPPTFPFLILDSFYRRATIRFDFKPDRDFLILASSVQCENENERLPFSTSPISSIVRHSEEIETRRENWNACISVRIWSFFLFFFFKIRLNLSI